MEINKEFFSLFPYLDGLFYFRPVTGTEFEYSPIVGESGDRSFQGIYTVQFNSPPFVLVVSFGIADPDPKSYATGVIPAMLF